jgi:hypothetical protein
MYSFSHTISIPSIKLETSFSSCLLNSSVFVVSAPSFKNLVSSLHISFLHVLSVYPKVILSNSSTHNKTSPNIFSLNSVKNNSTILSPWKICLSLFYGGQLTQNYFSRQCCHLEQFFVILRFDMLESNICDKS